MEPKAAFLAVRVARSSPEIRPTRRIRIGRVPTRENRTAKGKRRRTDLRALPVNRPREARNKEVRLVILKGTKGTVNLKVEA